MDLSSQHWVGVIFCSIWRGSFFRCFWNWGFDSAAQPSGIMHTYSDGYTISLPPSSSTRRLGLSITIVSALAVSGQNTSVYMELPDASYLHAYMHTILDFSATGLFVCLVFLFLLYFYYTSRLASLFSWCFLGVCLFCFIILLSSRSYRTHDQPPGGQKESRQKEHTDHPHEDWNK